MSAAAIQLEDDLAAPAERAGDRLLAPLDLLETSSPHVWSRQLLQIESPRLKISLRRYLFLGTLAENPLQIARVGIFGAIHGNEIEGPLAIGRFLSELARTPANADGFFLHCYPICNPTGFEDCTRDSRNGHDLDQEFWIGSRQPEVTVLEAELKRRAFTGIITLRSSAAATHFGGLVNREPISARLLAAGLRAAETFLPVKSAPEGEQRFIRPGMLQSPPDTRPRPFEIALISPRLAPLHLQVEAFTAALRAILAELRRPDGPRITTVESPSIR